MNAFRVAIANQKGGVAKTTNVINVGGALAARGHEVLVGDLDPQGYLTNTLNLSEAYRADPPSLYEAMQEPQDYHISELIVEHPEFDVLPSNVDMFRLEQDLIAAGWKPRERLQMLLRDLEEYAFVVLDAPPSLGPINDNALLAAENLLIPVEAADTSKLALEHLLNQIETLERRYELTITERGVIISNVNYPLDNEQRRIIEWYEETFDGRCPLYEVRHRAAIKRSLQAGGSIYGADAEETDQQEVYDAIAADLETAAGLEVPHV